MKRIIFALSLLLISGFPMKAQNDEVNALLKQVEGTYKIDNNDNVYVQEIIELDSSLKKDNLYYFAKEYITNSYGDANSVIQMDDKEKGLIICKGLYADIYCNEVFLGSATKYTATHILKFEIKDGRVRVTISITNINSYVAPSYSGGYYNRGSNVDSKMTDFYPINQGPRDWAEKKFKTREGYVFYRIIGRMKGTISAIRTTFSNPQDFNFSDENDDW